MDSPIPGLQYVMGTDTDPELYDTIVMANLVSTCTLYYTHVYDSQANLKFRKNPNLIRISSNLILSISTCICIRKN